MLNFIRVLMVAHWEKWKERNPADGMSFEEWLRYSYSKRYEALPAEYPNFFNTEGKNSDL